VAPVTLFDASLLNNFKPRFVRGFFLAPLLLWVTHSKTFRCY